MEAHFDFPHAEFFDRLDAVEARVDYVDEMAKELSEALSWMVRGSDKRMSSHRRLEAVGRRAIALTWAIKPALLDGLSLKELAMSFGSSPPHLAMMSGDVSRILNFRHRNAWNWAAI